MYLAHSRYILNISCILPFLLLIENKASVVDLYDVVVKSNWDLAIPGSDPGCAILGKLLNLSVSVSFSKKEDGSTSLISWED